MNRFMALAPALLGLAAVCGLPALADPPKAGTVKDRTAYIPVRKYAAVPGKSIGILLAGNKEIVALDGRSGPPDALVFSVDGNSYRWVYVPTTDNPQITNLQVPVGANGQKQVYPALSMANPRSVIPWGVTAPYSLVEVAVNGGMGSPAGESFVATDFKVLDGSEAFPLKVADVIGTLKQRYAAHLKTVDVEKALAEVAAKAIKDQKPTGPREKAELMYVTWLLETETLQVRFRTKISDGAYTITNNPNPKVPPFGPRPIPLPAPLPPQAVPPQAVPPQAVPLPPQAIPPGAVQGGNAGGGVAIGGVVGAVAPGGLVPARAIARPPNFQVRVGTTYGIEFGQAYDVNKKGEVVRVEDLPIASFTQPVNQRNFGPLPRPVPLPVPLPPGKVLPPVPRPDL